MPVLQDVEPKKRGRHANRSRELRKLLEQSQKELEELRAEFAGQAEQRAAAEAKAHLLNKGGRPSGLAPSGNLSQAMRIQQEAEPSEATQEGPACLHQAEDGHRHGGSDA